MNTRIQKWGNSLALRIPKSFAGTIGIEQGTLVDITLVDGKLIVTPLHTAAVTLEQLLTSITDNNLHGEQDMGQAIGVEVRE